MATRVFDRVFVTDANLTSSNVPEDDADEWSAAATYASGDRVMIAAVHTVYESVQGGNTDNDPLTDDGTWWVAVGATNYWKPFDETISDPATQAGSIVYTITPATRVSGIALFGLFAETVTIEVINGGTTVTRTASQRNLDHVQGWYSWFFGGRPREPEAVFIDLPWMGAGTAYRITISAAVGDVQVGEIVMGLVKDIGTTPWGAQIGIYSASIKQRDAYGNDVISQRSTAQIARIPVQVTNPNARRVQRLMQKLEAVPTVWIGDERTQYALILFGLLKDYSQTLILDNYSLANIEVEGRT